jgi:glycosyltransferase involved in cell wall biosynthesis
VTDAVVDGETGTLITPQSPVELASAIERLLLRPILRESMGDAARRRARAQFHVTSALATLESLYDRLLMSRAR